MDQIEGTAARAEDDAEKSDDTVDDDNQEAEDPSERRQLWLGGRIPGRERERDEVIEFVKDERILLLAGDRLRAHAGRSADRPGGGTSGRAPA